MPALVLNFILLGIFFGAHFVLPGRVSEQYPGLYVAFNLAAGALTYGCAALFLPLSGIREEARRWRRLLSMQGLRGSA
jgi:hypothetical protein